MNATDETKTIERLRASKLRATKSLFVKGEAAGTMYVSKHAEFLELERLSDWRDQAGWDEAEHTIHDVAKAMDEDSAKDILHNMRESYGDDINRWDWVHGFVTGAIAKFEEIKDQI